MNIPSLRFAAALTLTVPGLAWSQTPPPLTCSAMVTGPQNDPQGLRKDFATLGRCRAVLSAQTPDQDTRTFTANTTADVCVGRHTDSKTGRKTTLVWGDIDTKKDGGSFISSKRLRFAVADGKSVGKTAYGSEIIETGQDAPEALVIRRIEDFPSAKFDPNKDTSDTDDLLTFSKKDLTLRYEVRSRGNWPFQGLRWSLSVQYTLSCAKE